MNLSRLACVLLLALGCETPTIVQLPPPPPPPPPPVDPFPVEGEEVFTLDTLHHIDIELDPALFQQLDDANFAHLDTRFSANIVFDGVRVDNIGLRGKCGIGSCTSIFDKVGFSLKFDEFVAGQRLFGLKKLIINNSIQDTSYSNELLGQELARRAGLPAPRVSYAEVRLNGQLYGLFVLLESIDKQFLKRTFGVTNDEGNLYEGPCCGDFVFNPFFPELKDEDQGRTRDDLIGFADFIANASDTDFFTQIDTKLDLQKYLTQYALSALFFHWDGYEYNTNNYYIYHNPVDDRFVFWLHGLDQIFFDCGWPIDAPSNGRLGQRVQSDPAYAAMFHDEVRRILNEVWIPSDMVAFLDSARAVYEPAALADPTRGFDVGRFDSVRQCLLDRPANVADDLNAVCGNGVIEGFEECDDNNTAPGDGCSAVCRSECGDGQLQPQEGCDDGNRFDGDGCSSSCALEPQCGDGVVQPFLNEQCDDGRNGDNFSDGCRDDCQQNSCGDGLLDSGEQCDDGNTASGDGCDASCQDEDATSTCGNGLLEVGEECDDGNGVDADACDNSCLRPCNGADTAVFASLNNHCYLGFAAPTDWNTAESICESRGGHLATVHSQAEQQLVLLAAPSEAWIGLTDVLIESVYAWVTNEVFSFSSFKPGQPNDAGGQDCVRIEAPGWNDRPCTDGYSFVCELE